MDVLRRPRTCSHSPEECRGCPKQREFHRPRVWFSRRSVTREQEPDVTPDTPETLARIHQRAHELAPSKLDEAEPLFRQAIEGYRKIQGPDGALTLDLTSDLADLLDQTGRGAEAEPLFRAAPEGARKQFGPEDPRTAGMNDEDIARLSPARYEHINP
jgi:hypothetical protein